MRSRHIRSSRHPVKPNQYPLGGPLRTTIAAAVAAILAGPTVVWAQSAEAMLRGRAPPNTVVTAKNIATGAERHTTTSADGVYVLAGMPPGSYRVDAGPGTEQQITLSVSSNISYDFADTAAHEAALEEVVITGTRIKEVKTSEVGTIVDLHTIDVTPQITRNFLEFADTVPGMTFSVDAKGNTSLRGGAEVDQNINVYVDGVGMKDYVTNGGVSGQSGPSKAGDPGNPFPQLALAEYKVVTSNYRAQFDQVASAAIIAQTKSGTNEFAGEAFGNFTNQNLRADTPAELAANTPNNPKAQGETYEYGFAQGGPIIQNVAHFFVTYEHKDLSLPNAVFPNGQNGATLANLQAALPANVFAQFGPTTNPFKEDLIFAKLDYEASDSDRFELTDLTRLEKSVNGASGQVATSAAYDFKNNNERVMLLWQHAADRWMNEARITWESTLDSPEQGSGAPAFTYEWFNPPGPAQQAIQINGQDPRSYFRYDQSGVGIQDDFTLSNLTWHGNHTIQFGAKFKGVDLKSRDASEGANYYFAVDSTGTYPNPFQAVFTVNNPSQNITASSSDRQFGVYFQDTWQPTSKWTLDLGIRWDYETVPSWQNYTLPQAIVNALLGPFPATAANLPQPTPGETYAQALALGGYNINDYIGNGSNRKAPTNEFQPRIGFSYDIQDDQKHVLFGGYGRSYDRNVFDVMSLESTKLALSEPTIGFSSTPYTFNGCAAGAPATPTCVAWNNSYYTLANLQALANGNFGEIDLTNNKLKNPYSDQFSLGIRNRVGDWNTSVAIAQINSYWGIIGHLGNRYANGAYYFNGAQWSAQGVPGYGSLILWDNAEKDETTQLLVSAEKPYTRESHWGAGVAYTYSRALQNNPFSYQSNNGYAFDLPWPTDYPLLPSSAVPRHRLVLTYSTDGPWGLLYAFKLALATPTPIDAIEGCSPATAATVCHGFNAYPIVGYVRDWLQERTLDAEVTKSFDLPHDTSAYVRLDVLNVLNTPFYDPGAAIFSPSSTGAFGPPQYNQSAPMLGVPLTLKLTVGAKW